MKKMNGVLEAIGLIGTFIFITTLGWLLETLTGKAMYDDFDD